MTEICDACPVRRQTYGYLPSRETLSANRRQTVRSANSYFSCGILEMYRIPRCRRHIGTRHITVGISSAVLTARRPWLLIIWAFVGASTPRAAADAAAAVFTLVIHVFSPAGLQM